MSSSRVDLWYLRTDAVKDRATLGACAGLLTSDERARHDRFKFDHLKHEYLVTRGLERGVLAQYLNVSPRELSFRRTPHGRPLLNGSSDVRYNLTNTTDFVACAVVRGVEIGLDAEPLTRAQTILELAPTVFTNGERESLARLPSEASLRRAIELWTSKEAYVKARGLGFSLEVDKIDIARETENGWAIEWFDIEQHVVAICVEGDHRRGVGVVLNEADLAQLLCVDGGEAESSTTIVPPFDVESFAQDEDARARTAPPSEEIGVVRARLGPLHRIPELAKPASDVAALLGDPTMAFIVGFVDGVLPLEAIVDAVGLPEADVLRVFDRLVRRGLVRLRS